MAGASLLPSSLFYPTVSSTSALKHRASLASGTEELCGKLMSGFWSQAERLVAVGAECARWSLSGWLQSGPSFGQRGCQIKRESFQGPPTMADGEGLVSVDYEVFGKVQGVFFRKYTQAQGKKLGLVGWVQNTDDGTVKGQIQGPTVKVRQLQEWLQKTGSPKSHIDRAEFRHEKKIANLDHSDFCIVK